MNNTNILGCFLAKVWSAYIRKVGTDIEVTTT